MLQHYHISSCCYYLGHSVVCYTWWWWCRWRWCISSCCYYLGHSVVCYTWWWWCRWRWCISSFCCSTTRSRRTSPAIRRRSTRRWNSSTSSWRPQTRSVPHGWRLVSETGQNGHPARLDAGHVDNFSVSNEELWNTVLASPRPCSVHLRLVQDLCLSDVKRLLLKWWRIFRMALNRNPMTLCWVWPVHDHILYNWDEHRINACPNVKRLWQKKWGIFRLAVSRVYTSTWGNPTSNAVVHFVIIIQNSHWPGMSC